MMAERGNRISGSTLIEQGAEQFVRGVAGTLGNEVKIGGRMAVLGGAIGLVLGVLDPNRSAIPTAVEAAKKSAVLGGFLGWETAALHEHSNVTFVDWLIANALFFSDNTNLSNRNLWNDFWRSLLINTETVSGVKNILRGLWRKVWE